MSTVLESDLDPKLEQLANRMTAAFEGNDGDAYRQMFAPGAVVWLSYIDGTMPAEENADLLGTLYAEFVRELRYDDIRRKGTADGWVQQHVLTAVAKNGDTLRLGACKFIHLTEDGLIARIEEYIDSKMIAFAQEHHFHSSPA